MRDFSADFGFFRAMMQEQSLREVMKDQEHFWEEAKSGLGRTEGKVFEQYDRHATTTKHTDRSAAHGQEAVPRFTVRKYQH